ILYFLIVFLLLRVMSTSEVVPLSLHDALPISAQRQDVRRPAASGLSGRDFGPASLNWKRVGAAPALFSWAANARTCGNRLQPPRSEEHTSELQSRENLVCRLLLEKKKNK